MGEAYWSFEDNSISFFHPGLGKPDSPKPLSGLNNGLSGVKNLKLNPEKTAMLWKADWGTEIRFLLDGIAQSLKA